MASFMDALAAKAKKMLNVKSDKDVTKEDQSAAQDRLKDKPGIKQAGTSGLDKSHMTDEEVRKLLKEKR